jgi:predicted amidohydrolase
LKKNAGLDPDLIVLTEFFNTDIDIDKFKKLCEKENASETLAFFSEGAKKQSDIYRCR